MLKFTYRLNLESKIMHNEAPMDIDLRFGLDLEES
jgi:hypothetical protein